MTAHKPATPLPFRSEDTTVKYVTHGAWHTIARLNDKKYTNEANKENAAYLAHAANAYPKLVAALREYVNVVESVNNPNSFGVEVRDAGAPARALLRSLGEDA